MVTVWSIAARNWRGFTSWLLDDIGILGVLNFINKKNVRTDSNGSWVTILSSFGENLCSYLEEENREEKEK